MSVRFCVVIVERIKDARPPTYRPPLPQHESHGVPPTILTLMKQCWDEEPAQRPTFDEVAKALKSINKGKSASLTILLPFYSHRTVQPVLAGAPTQLKTGEFCRNEVLMATCRC